MILDLCSCPALHSLLYLQCSSGGASGVTLSPRLPVLLRLPIPSTFDRSSSDPHRPARCALQLSSALLQEAFQDLCHQAPWQCVTCACHPLQVLSPLRAGLCSILPVAGYVYPGALGFASVLCLLHLSTVLLQCESFV